MRKIMGIINYDDNFEDAAILGQRSLGAVSFLGRYRLIDFVLSNMTNSGIGAIQICVKDNPRSLIEHVDSGVQYNVNSKRGKLHILFGDSSKRSPIYNTDVHILKNNLHIIEESTYDYVVMAPSYMVYSIDFTKVIDEHDASKADVTMVYRRILDADEFYHNCQSVTVNKSSRVTKIVKNYGDVKLRNISLEAYVMKKDVFLNLIKHADEVSSIYTFKELLAEQLDTINVHGYQFKGMVYCINSLDMYYRASMHLLDYNHAKAIISKDWPVYTRTNDSEPTIYTDNANVKNSIVANGCVIEGTIENCVVGRDTVVKKGAVIKNSVIMADVVIGENVNINYTVIDKHVKVKNNREVIGKKNDIVYIGRNNIV